MTATTEAPITTLFVPGRAHDVGPDGDLILSESSIARVETTVAYFKQHEETFRHNGGYIRFEGGWAEAAGGVAKPPVKKREGYLAAQLAIAMGIPEEFIVAGIESTSTMDNCLRARHSLRGLGNVAIVTQESQADRLLYCAEKAMPGMTFTILEAPGEDDPIIHAEEQRLLRQSRLLYGWAWGSRTLRLADRLGTLVGNLLHFRPAAKYATAAVDSAA